MTAATVADMLGDLLKPAGSPAKAAKAANLEHPCGPVADSQPANGLRIPANQSPGDAAESLDSQTFAAIRNTENSPQSEQRRGFSQDSQDSQDSQGYPEAITAARVARAMRLGFEQQVAEALAERLRERDDHADYRHLCIECRHYRPGRCGNHTAAQLMTPNVGRDLATMFQDCPGLCKAT